MRWQDDVERSRSFANLKKTSDALAGSIRLLRLMFREPVLKADMYRRFAPVVEAKCSRMLRDSEEARDVMQETFQRLFNAGLEDAPVEVVTAWLYRTSTRLALDSLRRRKVRLAHAAKRSEPTAELEGRAIARSALERLVREVPADELAAVILHRADGLTQPEVAEVLGSSERSVRRLLKRFEDRRLG